MLVDLEAPVVARTLSKLDGAQVVAGSRHLACHTPQSALLFLGSYHETVESRSTGKLIITLESRGRQIRIVNCASSRLVV